MTVSLSVAASCSVGGPEISSVAADADGATQRIEQPPTAALAASSSDGGTELSGLVVNADGKPIEGATVRLQGTRNATRSDSHGAFRLRAPGDDRPKAVTAWKEGFFNGGERIEDGRSDYRIVLSALPIEDNSDYAFIAARPSAHSSDARKPCIKCHPGIVSEWERSSHAASAKNPLFLAVLSGRNRDGQLTGAPGYRLDFPESSGNCAACHAPLLALREPFGSDPTRARGATLDGIACDFCHKVHRTKVDDSGGRPGVLSMSLLRPPPGKDLFLGPLDDVIAGPDAFNPRYRDSEYCAPCHHGTFWNVRVYSEFEEWAASSYARRGVQCQDCHMKGRDEPRRFAPERKGAIIRDPATLSSHVQFGVRDSAFMRAAVDLKVEAAVMGNEVVVRARVWNVKAGHHLPTGSPMRNMVLLVEAVDAKGTPLPLVKGDRVPDWAGRGAPARGDYGGLPGKGFAKVLVDLVEYPSDRRRGRQLSRVFPAPQWRPTVVASDTRIPAETADESEYSFRLPEASLAPVTVRTRLIYRRSFRSWSGLGEMTGGELELARSEDTVSWRAASSEEARVR